MPNEKVKLLIRETFLPVVIARQGSKNKASFELRRYKCMKHETLLNSNDPR